MSEENQSLINLPTGELDKVADDKMFDSINSSGKFLPRIQLMTANSEKCKSDDFKINNYALVMGQDYKDIGAEVDVLVLAWRPKAMEMGDEVVAVHIPDDPEFIRIMEKSEESDSGCMYGPEFLLWSDKIGYATFFMGSKSARRESGSLRGLIGNASTLKSRLIKTSKYSWQAPQVTACSAFEGRPIEAEMEEEYTKFKNPPKSDVEVAGDEKATGDREV